MKGNRKWLSKIRSRLPVDKGSAIQRRIRAWEVQGEGGGCKIESIRSLDVGVEGAKARPDAALARVAKELVQETIGEAGRIGQSNPGAEVVIARIDEVFGNARVAGETISHGSRGEDLRLTSQQDVGIPIMPVGPKRRSFPTDSVVQRQIRSHTPTVLPVDPNVKVAQIKGCGSALGEIRGSANQHVREVETGLLTVEREAPVAFIIDLGNGHVIPVVVAAEFQGMCPLNFRKIILQLVRLSVLNAHYHKSSQRVVVEAYFGPILIRGAFQLIDAPLVGWGEPDRLEGWSRLWRCPLNVVVAHVACGKLVDGGTGKGGGNGKREQLGLTRGYRRKTRHVAATPTWIIGGAVRPGVV